MFNLHFLSSLPPSLNCLKVSSATHNGFSRIRRYFFSTILKPWKVVWRLKNTVGQGIWYDTFQVQNSKWLWLVNDIVTTMNSDNMLCGCFGLFPSYVAGILNSVKQINFYVLCNKRRLRCASYLEICVAGKECTFKLSTDNYLELTSGKDEVIIEFQSRFLVESSCLN